MQSLQLFTAEMAHGSCWKSWPGNLFSCQGNLFGHYCTEYFTFGWCCWKERLTCDLCHSRWCLPLEWSKMIPSEQASALLPWGRIARQGACRCLSGHISSTGSDWEGGLSEMWCVTQALLKWCSSLSCKQACAGVVCHSALRLTVSL